MSDRTTRFWVAGIFAGLAAIAAVAFLVLGPGRFDPSPPSLAGHPIEGLPGQIAYVDGDACINVVDPAIGETREVYCAGGIVQAITFIDADTLAFLVWQGKPNPNWTALDIATGSTTDLGTYPDPGWNYDPTLGGRIYIADDGEIFVQEGGERRSIYNADFPQYRQPQPITLSPDGNWLFVTYAAPRDNGQELWVIALDGSVARTITKHASWDMRAATWWVDGYGAAPEMDHPELPAARAS